MTGYGTYVSSGWCPLPINLAWRHTYIGTDGRIEYNQAVCYQFLCLGTVGVETIEQLENRDKLIARENVCRCIPVRDQRIDLGTEAGDDSKVVASPSQCPEEVRVLLIVGSHHRAVCGHDSHFEKVVRDKTVEALDSSESTTQTSAQTTNTCAGAGGCDLPTGSEVSDDLICENATTSRDRVAVRSESDTGEVTDVDLDSVVDIIQRNGSAVPSINGQEREVACVCIDDLRKVS